MPIQRILKKVKPQQIQEVKHAGVNWLGPERKVFGTMRQAVAQETFSLT